MNDEKIIKDFYDENFRVPTFREFKLLGGSIKTDYFYKKLTDSLGYPRNQKNCPDIIEVFLCDEFVFSGSADEIAEEFGIHPSNVRKALKKGKWREHTLKKKVIERVRK